MCIRPVCFAFSVSRSVLLCFLCVAWCRFRQRLGDYFFRSRPTLFPRSRASHTHVLVDHAIYSLFFESARFFAGTASGGSLRASCLRPRGAVATVKQSLATACFACHHTLATSVFFFLLLYVAANASAAPGVPRRQRASDMHLHTLTCDSVVLDLPLPLHALLPLHCSCARRGPQCASGVLSRYTSPTPFFVFPPCVQYFVVVTRQTTKLQRVKRADEKRLRKKNPGKGAVTHILNILNSHSGAMGRYLASSSRLNSTRPPATYAHSGTVRGRGPHRLDGWPPAQTHQQGCSTARQRADSAGWRCWALWAVGCTSVCA